MSTELKKLMKQKEALEKKIKDAEVVAKNRNRVERVVVKLVEKRPKLISADIGELEKQLDAAIDQVLKDAGWIVND